MATDFSLLPGDDPQLTPDDQVNAAIGGALADPTGQAPVTPDAPVPFGRSWQFDWEQGQFVHAGDSPADTSGFGALVEWCQMALHSARYAHPAFSDEFGMEKPDSAIGYLAVGEVLADWQREVVDALMVHDRITSVENFDVTWDPTVGVLTINNFDIVTDEDETVMISDVTLRAAGGVQ